MYKVTENTNSLMVLEALAQSIKTFLGCNKSIKCFIDENDETASQFLITPMDFLQNVNVLHPAIHIITESCNQHCKEHDTSSTTLLVMAGLLAKETGCLNKQGIPVPVIMKLFDEGLEICTQTCEQIAINLSTINSWSTLNTVDHKRLGNLLEGYSDTNVYVSTIINMQDKCDYDAVLEETCAKIATMPEKDCKTYEILSNLGLKLSHGDYSLARLAINALWNQYQDSKCSDLSACRYHLATINVIEILGPSIAESALVSGIIIKCSNEIYSLCRRRNMEKLNIILINGDITFQFRHIGYEDKYKEVTYITANQLNAGRQTEEDKWLQSISNSLFQNNIGLLAVKGYVDQRVVDLCHCSNIILLSELTYNQLKALSLSTGNPILTYVPDLHEIQMGLTITVKPWICGWNFKKTLDWQINKAATSCYILINCEAPNTAIQTVTICGTCRASIKSAQRRFKSCLNRIYNTLRFGKCLPGGGLTELACSETLKSLANGRKDVTEGVNYFWSHELNLYRSAVYTRLIDVFDDYVATILLNDECRDKFEAFKLMNQFKKQHANVNMDNSFIYSWPILDDFAGKIAAWKQAIHIVKILANSDYVIITDAK